MKYTNEQLAYHFCADLITDARTSLKYARAVDRGETGYGCTADEYRASAAANKAQFRAIRSAAQVSIGRYGEVTPV